MPLLLFLGYLDYEWNRNEREFIWFKNKIYCEKVVDIYNYFCHIIIPHYLTRTDSLYQSIVFFSNIA